MLKFTIANSHLRLSKFSQIWNFPSVLNLHVLSILAQPKLIFPSNFQKFRSKTYQGIHLCHTFIRYRIYRFRLLGDLLRYGLDLSYWKVPGTESIYSSSKKISIIPFFLDWASPHCNNCLSVLLIHDCPIIFVKSY